MATKAQKNKCDSISFLLVLILILSVSLIFTISTLFDYKKQVKELMQEKETLISIEKLKYARQCYQCCVGELPEQVCTYFDFYNLDRNQNCGCQRLLEQ